MVIVGEYVGEMCVCVTFVAVINNISRGLQASNWAKECQFNRAELRDTKDNSCKRSEN